MFVYIDESGNTGENIFDPAQPFFFTGALITRTKFDLIYSNQIRNICKKHNIVGLHASVLGFGGIEPVASEILAILKKADARFFISKVEKRYLLATKIFDTFFDSGENPAVPWHAYNVKLLKLILCFKLASIISEEIAPAFWKMLMAKTEKLAREMLPEICGAILREVGKLADQRTRDIVSEALTWSRDHPEALDIFINRRQAKNNHLPNMVAFANLLDGLEAYSKKWKRPVREILHDRQSQFEVSLNEWHEMFSNASDEPIHWPGQTIVFQKVAGSTFKVSASGDSAGIQIVDTVIWIYKRFLEGRHIPPNSSMLLDYVFRRGYHSDFSFEGVGASIECQLDEVMSTDLSKEAWEFSRSFLQKTEDDKRWLIDQYEVDKLMPYQRSRAASIDTNQ